MPENLDLSTYNLEDNWINDIAKKYFDITDINLLKVGLFGYVNEVMASAVEDHYEHELIMSNEIFPNKAVIPNSIYAYTALARYDDFNAKPSTIYFSLIMKKDDIIKQSVDTKYGYKELIIKIEIKRIKHQIVRGSIITPTKILEIKKYIFRVFNE